MSAQLNWNYPTKFYETWYVARTPYLVLLVTRKFGSLNFFLGFMPLWTYKYAQILINYLISATPLNISFRCYIITVKKPLQHPRTILWYNLPKEIHTENNRKLGNYFLTCIFFVSAQNSLGWGDICFCRQKQTLIVIGFLRTNLQ